ncbi:cytochrome b561 [Brenneria roseae subsp. roseae]|uniref:cytochrome b561 n=1 Tax=Brenneria roseae TaxID=1509241 RepID=UPI000D6116FE|nr:cytochrome b561 [Brenneria roseae]PWC20840.1 cytochrome b561 [Brenneria roseae subsp. roseae]
MKKYAPSQIFFHWIIFVLIVVTYCAMELRGLVPRGSNAREWMRVLHYTCGLSVLILSVARIVIKITHQEPEIVPPLPRWQRILAKSVHGVLYLMFIGLPLMGALSLYYGGIEWSFFFFPMPFSAEPDLIMESDLIDIHETIASVGYFIIGLHAAAALYHHYIVRDNTLIRMMPGKRKG